MGMATNNNNIELRSEEVQEIMGTPPKWIIRWGITIIFTVVLVLLAGSYFYKYPDIVDAQVTILSENPPIPIVARAEGKLEHLFVSDKQDVQKDEVLGVVENPANCTDIFSLMDVLDSVRLCFGNPDSFRDLTLKNDYMLGQYQAYYSSFLRQLEDYKTFLFLNPNDQRVVSLQKQVADYDLFLKKSQAQIDVLRQDYQLVYNQFLRDSVLFAKGVMSEVEFEKSKMSMLKQKYSYQNEMTNLANAQMMQNQLGHEIKEQELGKNEGGKKLITSLREDFDNLVNQLNLWEQTFVLKSPIEGKVAFNTFWSVNQFVSLGDIVFTVVPRKEQKVIGRAVVPVTGVGKVKKGQRVNIKLDNFPYLEFGIVEGRVANISMVPLSSNEETLYTIELELVNGLTTNYKKELPFSQEMQGEAEIITEDLRLIQRFFNPFKAIWKERVTQD